MDDIKQGIQYMFQTQNLMTLAVSGTGHTAMECAIFNTVEPGDSVLAAVNGIWGERAAEMAQRVGKPARTFARQNRRDDFQPHKSVTKSAHYHLRNRIKGCLFLHSSSEGSITETAGLQNQNTAARGTWTTSHRPSDLCLCDFKILLLVYKKP